MNSSTAADAIDLVKQGAVHHRRRELEAAERCYRKALSADPGNADANNLLGVLLASRRKLGMAAHHLRLAVAARPGEASFRNNLGNALVSATEYPEAIRHLEEAVRLDPGYAEAHANLGKAYGSAGRIGDARRQFERALALDPWYSVARLGLARMEKEAGYPDRAVAAFRRLLDRAPGDVSLLVSILGCLNPATGSPELAAAEQICRTRLDRLSRREQRQLLVGLGRAYDGMGRHAEAIDFIIRGKAIVPPPYDIDRRIEWCRQMRELFTRQFYAKRTGFGSPSEAPVFIVGMVRSGSSLIEQVLASHPAVAGLGESPFMFKVVRVAGIRHTENELDAGRVRSLRAQEILEMAETYLRHIGDKMGSAVRATDKQLLNFQNLGFIRLLFPNARIIHTRRNPIDTCLSSFLIDFDQGNLFNNNMRDLGLFYREYVGLMNHWRDVAGLRLLEVDYEDTVADLESVARRIIDFLGLPWDDRCLRFHETQRSVKTASHAQVREPVHDRSVGRWKRYG
ncbi:MAG: sulfotransferase, partial [Pseudomonadota bacterium]|nr:sulfotransferase [Pseudomonadota bacterium]